MAFILSLFLCESCFGMKLIRDAEIETFLTEMVKPIFKVAGLKENSAKVFLINSDEINAFTIGNGYIFVNSGLLLKFKEPSQLIAVLAHETAHIAAGHINRLMVSIQQTNRNMTGAMLLGVLGTVLTGSDAAFAAALGYMMAEQRFFLRYSRGEEFAADALGASYLEKIGYDPNCMISVFQTFQDIDILNGGEHVPQYVKSHPDAAARILAIKNRKKISKTKLKNKADENFAKTYLRISAKVKAFIKRNQEMSDDYSKAIYYQHHGKINDAIKLLENLVQKYPDDIFYKETLARCFYESGNQSESIKIYEKIFQKNISPIIQKDYAEVLIESGKNLETAIKILETIKYDEIFDENIYRLLSIAYGKQKKFGLSYLNLAKEQMMLGKYQAAEELLNLCIKNFDEKKSYIEKAKYLKELIARAKK